MIELMVSLFIFSVGLLGFATLQTRSLQEGFDSGQRSILLWRSQELSDRIRANSGQLDTYLAAVAGGAAICDAAPANRCADFAGGDAEVCTAAQMATFDVWDVLCNGEDATDTVLIDANISLSCTDSDLDDPACSPGSSMTIDACWTSKSATSDDQLAVVRGAEEMPDCTDEDADANSFLFEYYTLEFVP